MTWTSRSHAAVVLGALALLGAGCAAAGAAGDRTAGEVVDPSLADPWAADSVAAELANADDPAADEDLDPEAELHRLHYDLRYDRWVELHRRAAAGNDGRAWLAEAEALASVAEEFYVEARYEIAITYIEDAVRVLETSGAL